MTYELLREEAQENSAWMRLAMEFEEKRGGQGMQYWLSKNSRFGTAHMQNPTHGVYMFQKYDFDIKLAFVLPLLWLVKKISCKLFCGK